MAGLFDMFGGNPQSQGLLAAAAQILQASGPSRTPTSFGQILGSGLGAYQQQEQQARQTGQQEQMRGLQIQEAESELAMKAAQRKRAQEFLDFQTAYGKSRGGQPQAASMPAPQSADTIFRGAVGGGMAPQQPAMGGAAPAPAAPAGGAGGGRNALVQERLQYAQALRDNGYSAEANAAEEQALKLQPKVKGWEKVQQDGKVMFAPFFEDGTNGAPVPLEVAEKLNAVNRGGATDLTNAYTGATVRSLTNSASPDALVSAATQRENSMRQDARAREANDISRQRLASLSIEGKPMTALQETKYRTQIAKDYQAANTLLANMADVGRSAAEVKTAPGLKGATGLQSYFPSVPNGKAAQAEVKLQNLEGKVTQLGKAAAAQGGAVGPMAVQEWKIVRDMIAAIDPAKGDQSLLEQVGLVEEQAKGAAARLQDAYSKHYSADFNRYPQFEQLAAPQSPADKAQKPTAALAPAPRAAAPANAGAPRKSAMKGQVMDGYRFKGGNPADPNAWEKL